MPDQYLQLNSVCRLLTGIAFTGLCALLCACNAIDNSIEAKKAYDSGAATNPKGVEKVIQSVLALDELPRRYKIITAQKSSDFTEIRIDDNTVNMPISIIRAKNSEPPATPEEIVNRVATTGLPFKSAASSTFVTGKMSVKGKGNIVVAGKDLFYEVGTQGKPFFRNTIVPCFVGAVIEKGDYILFCAQEPDGWLPEKKRKLISVDLETGEQKGFNPEWVNEEHVTKEFDLQGIKDFFQHITKFN